MSAPDVLAFADRKTDGAYAVTEPSGAVVALIRVKTFTMVSFTVTTAAGEPLCTGRRTGFWTSRWEATAPSGAVLCTLKGSGWGTGKTVTLGDGRALSLRGRLFARDWALLDDQGREVLSSTPSTSSWSFSPDAWVVRSHDTSLDLAQVVAIVQLNRMMVKGSRSSAAVAT